MKSTGDRGDGCSHGGSLARRRRRSSEAADERLVRAHLGAEIPRPRSAAGRVRLTEEGGAAGCALITPGGRGSPNSRRTFTVPPGELDDRHEGDFAI